MLGAKAHRRTPRGAPEHGRALALGGVLMLLAAMSLLLRFGYDYVIFSEKGARHIQSLLVALLFATAAVFFFALTLLSALTRHNRVLIEETLMRLAALEASVPLSIADRAVR